MSGLVARVVSLIALIAAMVFPAFAQIVSIAPNRLDWTFPRDASIGWGTALVSGGTDATTSVVCANVDSVTDLTKVSLTVFFQP